MKESGRYLSVLATTLILASCRPVTYPENPTPPKATSTVPSATPQTETLSPTTREEKIYYQTLFDTQEFLATYVKSPELQTCIMSMLEKQQFLKEFKEPSGEIHEGDNFSITYNKRAPDGKIICGMGLDYVSNKLRAITLETDSLNLFPNQLTQFTNEENPKFIPDDKLIDVANEIYKLPPDVQWQDVNLGFSRRKNPGKIAEANSDSGGYLEAFIFTQGQSGFFISFPKIGSKL